MVIVEDKIDDGINMILRCWLFQLPWRSASAIRSASPNAACPGLLRKPLNASIGQLLTPYCLAAARATGKQTTINKYTYKAGRFNGHGNAPVRNRVHCPMEQVQGFTKSHWTPPLGEYYVR
jgi:hypothetical protein